MSAAETNRRLKNRPQGVQHKRLQPRVLPLPLTDHCDKLADV